MNNINLIKTLCFSGLVPFYFLSIITVFNFNFLFVDLFSLYSLVILTFLSGSTWYHLIIVEKKETNKRLVVFIVNTKNTYNSFSSFSHNYFIWHLFQQLLKYLQNHLALINLQDLR
jgi:hypothetical protein